MTDKCKVEQNEHHIRIKVGCMEIYAESNDMHDLITVYHADNSPFRFDDQKIVDIANGEIFDISKNTKIFGNYMKKCVVCGKAFQAKRKDKKFCKKNGSCSKAYQKRKAGQLKAVLGGTIETND